jgi:hypothetical protein
MRSNYKIADPLQYPRQDESNLGTPRPRTAPVQPLLKNSNHEMNEKKNAFLLYKISDPIQV